MDDFLEFLSKKRIVTAKLRPFYAIWVRNMYHFLRHMPGSPVLDDDVNRFIATITDTHQDWQVQQAKDAIRLYRYFLDQPRAAPFARSSVIDKLWVDAVDQMLVFMRLKHMSLRTEQTYITWMRQFYRYVKAVKPLDLKSKHVADFLTYLTIARKVAKTTPAILTEHGLSNAVNRIQSELLRQPNVKRSMPFCSFSDMFLSGTSKSR